MKISELDPRWLTLGGASRVKGGFCFRCPHCRVMWLTCKLIPADEDEQELAMEAVGITPDQFVPTLPTMTWTIEGDFPTLNVFPSIIAPGHMRLQINNGEIIPV